MTAAKSSTVVVELTPPGRAAVAAVLVAGPDAVRTVADCFVPVSPRPLDKLPLGRIALGRWGGADGEELIVCRRGEQQIEIHCHGGAAAVRGVIDQLVERGCRHISWQSWLQDSLPNPLRAAAQVALADAPTARTAAILLDQYHGALRGAIQTIAAAIGAADWGRAADIVAGVLQYRDLGLHLTTPWHVVLAGPPNVGKSSLINALAGFQRAIVSPQPGTTRDVVTLGTAIDGWPVQLADTAGLRAAQDELESAGVALANAALSTADLVVIVSDASGNVHACEEVTNRLSPMARVIHARNKIDLLPPSERRLESENRDAVLVSALTGEGIAGLVAAIAGVLVPAAPPPGAAVASTLDQVASLQAVREAIDQEDSSAAERALAALLAE
jgi:tRNA modification GTPase